VKRETTEQLDLFRRQQEEADKVLLEGGGDKEAADGGDAAAAGESQWAVNGRKRKRVKEKEVLKGVKLRKSSTTEVPIGIDKESFELENEGAATEPKQKPSNKNSSKTSRHFREEVLKEAKGAPPARPKVISAKASAPGKQDGEKATTVPGLGLGGYSSDEED